MRTRPRKAEQLLVIAAARTAYINVNPTLMNRTLTCVIERVQVHARGMLEREIREHTVARSARRQLNSRSVLAH